MELGAPLHIPERSYGALVDAALGFRVQRPKLVDVGLLEAQGQTRGRYYVAGAPIRQLRRRIREARRPLFDPYPELMPAVRAALAKQPPTNMSQ